MDKIGPVGILALTFVAGATVGVLLANGFSRTAPPPPPRSLFRDLLCATMSGVSSALTTKALA